MRLSSYSNNYQLQSQPQQSFIIPYLYAIGSNILFIIAQFLAKMQTTIVSPYFIIYYRSLIMLIFNSLLIYRQNLKTKSKMDNLKQDLQITLSQILMHQEQHKIITLNIIDNHTFLFMVKRVIFASISMTLFTMSLKYVQLSIASVLFQTAPVFSFFIDAIVNKILLKKIHLVLTFVAFIGVCVIVIGEGNKTEPIINQNDLNNSIIQHSYSIFMYLLPLGAALTSACSMSYLHKMKDKVHPLLTVQYLMIGALITSGLMYNFEKQQQIIIKNHSHKFFDSIFSVPFIYATIIMSLLVFGSQYCRVKALFMLPASRVAPLHYVGIILSILIDLFVFGYEIKWYQYFGMILATSGLFMKLLLQKRQQSQRKSLMQFSRFSKF